jgi:arylsulfatase A-like enzyme
MIKTVNIEIGNDPDYQLYNLKEDLGQQNNLAKSHPEKLAEMKAAYEKIVGSKLKTEKLELK